MANFTELTPDPSTAFTPPGDIGWRDYFLRQQAFLSDITKQVVPWLVGSVPFVTANGYLSTNSTLTQAALEALIAGSGGGTSYIPLALGSEPLQFVSDGAGQPILIAYSP